MLTTIRQIIAIRTVHAPFAVKRITKKFRLTETLTNMPMFILSPRIVNRVGREAKNSLGTNLGHFRTCMKYFHEKLVNQILSID